MNEWSYPKELYYILSLTRQDFTKDPSKLALKHHHNLPTKGELLGHTNHVRHPLSKLIV